MERPIYLEGKTYSNTEDKLVNIKLLILLNSIKIALLDWDLAILYLCLDITLSYFEYFEQTFNISDGNL
jgi:hypothetical protein